MMLNADQIKTMEQLGFELLIFVLKKRSELEWRALLLLSVILKAEKQLTIYEFDYFSIVHPIDSIYD